jgi:O-antigen/teichoic acid export membrane protein
MSSNSKLAFFRQSSWMVIATFVGGLFMAMVHTVARKMGSQEYSTFVSLLRLLIIMSVPASALQTIFARQAAAVTTDHQEALLRATTRAILTWTFVIWLICGGAVLAGGRPLSRLLNVSNPAALYFTVVLVLTGLWVPLAKGLLQGKHLFGGLGWLQICDGVGRFSFMVLIVIGLGGKAAGGMFAAVVGQLFTVVLGAWLTRRLWRTRPAAPFRWRAWLRDALPLTFGLGTVLVMSSIDMIFVQGLFSDTGLTALYGGAMLTGFAIIQFIAPVALVMFARVAQNVARAERADSLGMTLAATVLFGCVAAIGCTVLPKLPLRLMYFGNREMWEAAPLVPWFAWALLPLTVANVLVQNILARGRFQAVPWLVLVPAVYAACLCLQAQGLLAMKPFDAFIRVIQTLGGASLLLCAVAAWFTRGALATGVSGPDLEPARATPDKASSRSA